MHESLPFRAPRPCPAEGVHGSRGDRMSLVIDKNTPAANESQAGMVEIVLRPVTHADALRHCAVPQVQFVRKQRYATSTPRPMADVMFAHLAVIIRQPIGVSLR